MLSPLSGLPWRCRRDCQAHKTSIFKQRPPGLLSSTSFDFIPIWLCRSSICIKRLDPDPVLFLLASLHIPRALISTPSLEDGYCAIELNYLRRLPNITHQLRCSFYTRPGNHFDKQGIVPDFWLTVMKHAVSQSFIKREKNSTKYRWFPLSYRWRWIQKKYRLQINQMIKVNVSTTSLQLKLAKIFRHY